MSAARKSDYETRVGNSSVAQQKVLDELQAIISGSGSANFRPYLVRALKAVHASKTSFINYTAQMCGSVAAPSHGSDGDLHSPPERSAQIRF
ncbi:MAG TPA: hypothetical protein VMO78_04415 [Rhizomicrobium sp.]|nr:hypothetical protein [Rhizomicrobium sp.]